MNWASRLKFVFSKMRDQKQIQLERIAQNLVHLPIDKKIKAFNYLSSQHYLSPHHFKQFQVSIMPMLHQLNPQQLLLLIRSYSSYRQFFSDSLKFNRNINAALSRLLNKLTQEEHVRVVLRYCQLLNKQGQDIIQLYLSAAAKAFKKNYQHPARTRIILAAIESTDFNFELVMKGLQQIADGFNQLSQKPALILFGYLVYSPLIQRQLQSNRQSRQIRLQFKGYDINNFKKEQENFIVKLSQFKSRHAQAQRKVIENFVLNGKYSISLLVLALDFMGVDQLKARIESVLKDHAKDISPYEAVALTTAITNRSLLQHYHTVNHHQFSIQQHSFITHHLNLLIPTDPTPSPSPSPPPPPPPPTIPSK